MMTPEMLQGRLQDLVGPAGIEFEPAQTAAFAIDTQRPTAVVRPGSIEQAAEVVAFAGRERLALVPWGQGSQMHLGKAPQCYDLALSLIGLNRLIEYDVANLTLIAEAGLPLREVYRASIPERQFLPLGFPGSMASLGGLLATNSSGVKRMRYGGMRDLLLGVRAVLADGSQVRFGGRVVKNVAGYDMNKLFIGSLGVFGVLLETTYRLAALPEDDRILAVTFASLPRALAAAAAVQASQLLPSALTLCSAAAIQACTVGHTLPCEPENVTLLLNFDGTHEAVERQVRDSREFCQQHDAQAERLLSGEALLAVWEFQDAWRSAPEADRAARLQVRLGTLPSRLEDAVQQLATAPPYGQSEASWLAEYSSGQLLAHLPVAQPEADQTAAALTDWLHRVRAWAAETHGYCVVEYAPAHLRQQLDLWGEPPAVQLLRLYKQRFDPHAVLNPGRYIAGL